MKAGDSVARRRCPVCRLLAGSCLCPDLPRTLTRTRIAILQHAKEGKSASDTASLVHHVLEGSFLSVHADRARQGRPLDLSFLEEAGTDWAVLFPSASAREISAESGRSPPGRRLGLVVIDGTWSQSRKMAHRIPGIRELPFLRLGETGLHPEDCGPPAFLRKAPRPGLLGTADAVAGALEVLGEEAPARVLRTALELITFVALRERGKVRWSAEGPEEMAWTKDRIN